MIGRELNYQFQMVELVRSLFTTHKILTGNGTSPIQAQSNLSFDGSTLTITGDLSLSGSLSLDSVTVSAIQTSSETFADNDASLMTSAAIYDKIELVSSTLILVHV